VTLRPRLYEAAPGSMSAPLEKLFKETAIRYIQGSVETIRTEHEDLTTSTATFLVKL
jgi:NADH dehydrogenase